MKTKILIQLKKETRGQALVELAISLIVLLMLLLGAVEIGVSLIQYVTVRDAAQDAVVYASINPLGLTTDPSGGKDTAAIKARAIQAASGVIVLTEGQIVITRSGAACEAGTNTITVTITYPHKIIIPFVNTIGINNITLTGTATNKILTPRC